MVIHLDKNQCRKLLTRKDLLPAMIRNQQVAGSIPAGGSSNTKASPLAFDALSKSGPMLKIAICETVRPRNFPSGAATQQTAYPGKRVASPPNIFPLTPG